MKTKPHCLRNAAFAVLLATALFAQAQPSRFIPGAYIVTLRADVNPEAFAAEARINASHLFKQALKGFAGHFSDAQVERLRRDPRVTLIEPDEIVQAGPADPGTVETTASWGLDRINQRGQVSGGDGLYSYDRTGAGVTVYVIDSGIRYSHTEFSGRARFGFDALGADGSDCNGHGTWVAGIIGGLTRGVAKQVNLVSVRVFDCSGGGPSSSVIAGVDWVIAHRVGPSVANLSMTGSSSAFLNAVQALVNSGVATAVSAGNGDYNSCDYLLPAVDGVMATGGTNADDTREKSAYGSCISWFAPGVNIPGASHTDNSSFAVKSGTSGATAFSSGRAALYLEGVQWANAREVRDALYAFTTKNVVKLAGTANNHLLFSFDEVGLSPTDRDITAPAITIVSPAGATVPKRTTVTVTANASDNVGITRVEFYMNGVFTATDTTAPYTCNFTTANKPGTSYQISARAIDAALNLGIATISVTTK
jgi:hypothetical protein